MSTVAVNALRVLGPVALAAGAYAIQQIRSDPNTFRTDASDPVEKKLERSNNRALLSSLLNGVITSVLAAVLLGRGASSSLVAINTSMIFANVSGFMFDSLLVSDEGLAKAKQGTKVAAAHIGGKIMSWDFLRYIVTVLLDVMLVTPVLNGASSLLDAGAPSIRDVLKAGNWYDNIIANNIDTVLGTIAGLVMFNAYSQNTKSLWAYVDPSVPLSKRIPGIVVMVATAVAAAMFVSYTSPYAEPVGTRLMYAVAAFVIMTALNMKGHADKTPDEVTGNPKFGWMIFLAFAALGILVPFMGKRT